MATVIAAIGLTAVLTSAATVAIADHQFPDVPNSGFHDQIGAIVDAGCAAGFDDGTFRPRDGTTRGQFAYWMNNCGGRVAHSERTTPLTIVGSNNTQPITQVTITAGAIGGTGGFVVLQGNMFVDESTEAPTDCPCAIRTNIREQGQPVVGQEIQFALAPGETEGASTQAEAAGSVARVFPIGPNETVTYELVGWYDDDQLNDLWFRGSLTAIYVPFGSSGGDSL